MIYSLLRIARSASFVAALAMFLGLAATSASAQDMTVAFTTGTVPTTITAGATYTIGLRCVNSGNFAAQSPTCVPSVSAGTVSGIVCMPVSPFTLPAGSAIDCTFSYTAPNPFDTVSFVGDTSATNDTNTANNRTTVTVSNVPAAPGGLFVQSEQEDVIGQGRRYNASRFVILPVLEALGGGLPDNTVRVRTADSASPQQPPTAQMLFAAWNPTNFTLGELPLQCAADPNDQCTTYYATGINPRTNNQSNAFATIGLQGRFCAEPYVRFATTEYLTASGTARDITDPEINEFVDYWGFTTGQLISTDASGVVTRRKVRDIVQLSIDFEQVCAANNDFGRLFGSLRVRGGGASFPWTPGSAKVRGYSIPQLGSDAFNGSLTTVLPDNARILVPLRMQRNFRRQYPEHIRESAVSFNGANNTLGIGGPVVVTSADADFSAEPLYGDILKGVRVRGKGPGFDMVMDLGAGYNQPLHTNCRSLVCYRYKNLQRRVSKDDITPGIDVILNSRRCGTVTGSMAVREAHFDGNQVTSFAADIDFTCDSTATIRSEIRFNSDLPLQDYDEDGIPDTEESSSRRAQNEPDNYLLAANSVDSVPLFVRQQYRDLAGREASITTYTRDQLEIELGGKTRSQFLTERFNSAEFSGLSAPVARLYRATFGRNAEVNGLNYWSSRLRSFVRPMSQTQLAAIFVSSAEFVARYGALNNRQFVQQLYQNVLGRAGDAGGENYWTAELDSGRQTRAQVVLGFSESPENVSRTANETTVILAYYGLLRRDASGAELSGYTNLLNGGGLSLSALLDHIARSQEYCERFLEFEYCRVVTNP